MHHETPVCTALCFRNVSCSHRCRFSRSVTAVGRSFGRAAHLLRPSIGHSCSPAVVRFGTGCCTHTCHRIDRFGDSDHRDLGPNLGLVCNHGLGPVDNQDTAPGQYRFRMSQFPKRQRMPVRAHLIFYSSNSLVLIPPLLSHRQLPCPRVRRLKKVVFCSKRSQLTRYGAPLTDIVRSLGHG